MKERPIVFSAPTVSAILDGSKTQTRRVVNDLPPWEITEICKDASGTGLWMPNGPAPSGRGMAAGHWRPCPYGRPGDRLSVPGADGLLLEVVDVRAERLNACSEADAKAEGAPACARRVVGLAGGCESHLCGFRQLWRELKGAGSWDANPWVWVVEFKRVTP